MHNSLARWNIHAKVADGLSLETVAGELAALDILLTGDPMALQAAMLG